MTANGWLRILVVALLAALISACGGSNHVRPTGAVLTQQTRSIFSGRTWSGYHKRKKFHFKRYYAPDGSMYGESREKGKRRGRWFASGNKLCFSWQGGRTRCRKVERPGYKVYRYNRKGNRIRVVYNRWMYGNKLSWGPGRGNAVAGTKPAPGYSAPARAPLRFRLQISNARIGKGSISILKSIRINRYTRRAKIERKTIRPVDGVVFIKLQASVTLLGPRSTKIYRKSYIRLKTASQADNYGYSWSRKIRCYISNRKVHSQAFSINRAVHSKMLFIVSSNDVNTAVLIFQGREYPLSGLIKAGQGSI